MPGRLAMMLAWALIAAQLDLDCSSPAAARSFVGRVMLSEIEGAEDINRAAMWEAFGHCAAGPGRDACVSRERQRFEGEWERQKAAIKAKYRKILDDFETRCRASPV